MAGQEGEGCEDCPDHTISLIDCTQMGAGTEAVKASQPAVVCVITNTNNGHLTRFVRSIKELSNGESPGSVLSAESLQGSDLEPA